MIAPEVRREWCAALDEALTLIEAHPVLRAGGDSDPQGIARLRLHGDCHPGNVLWTDQGPHFVDLDDARQGPAVQDLWMLAPDPRALELLLQGYTEMRDFDYAELALVEPLRVLRQVHWAGWIAQRWHDPAFPQGFPFVGEARWWEQHVNDLIEARLRLEEH